MSGKEAVFFGGFAVTLLGFAIGVTALVLVLVGVFGTRGLAERAPEDRMLQSGVER